MFNTIYTFKIIERKWQKIGLKLKYLFEKSHVRLKMNKKIKTFKYNC